MNRNIDLWESIHGKKLWKSDGDYPSQNAQAFLEWHLTSNVNPVNRLLDLGCGTGAATCFFKKMLPETEVYAIDASEAALDTLKKRSELLLLDIKINKSDFRTLPYPDQYFQAIFSESVIYYGNKEDFKQGVNEIFRTLAPGGICRVYTKTNRDVWALEGKPLGDNTFRVVSTVWEEGLEIYCATIDDINESFSGFVEVSIGIKEFNYMELSRLHSFWVITCRKP